MNAFVQTVKDTPVPRGAAVWWLGQMGLLVKLSGTLLCVDYCASELPGRRYPPPIPAGELTGIDVFLGTHDHADHIDRPAWQLWARQNPDALFVFPAVHRQSLIAGGISPARCRCLNDGESCRIGDITVRAVAAAHEFLSRDPATGLYPCLQYLIEGDGVRLWHAGDTLRYEGLMPKLKGFGPIDAALLPINGRDASRYLRGCIGNMTFQEAADLAGELRPRLTLPGHWDLFADNPGDPDAFTAYLNAKYPGLPCAVPRRMEPIRIQPRQDK